eukprot:12817795-Heterocapsa_arctica.AAC.1
MRGRLRCRLRHRATCGAGGKSATCASSMAAVAAALAAGTAGRNGSPAAGIRGSRGCQPADVCGRPWQTPLDGTAHFVVPEWAGSVGNPWSTHSRHIQSTGRA